MKYLTAAVIATSLLCTAPLTRAATIDFGNTDGRFTTPYTEENFRFTVVSGDTWRIQNTTGNPPSSLNAGATGPIGIGDTISVMQLGGGLFTFTALDFASFVGTLQSDGVSLIGLVNGLQTEMSSNLNSNTNSFQTLDPLFLKPIDELQIVGASDGDATLLLDNFVLNPVGAPVPETGGTMVLMLGALAALVVWRRLAPGVNAS